MNPLFEFYEKVIVNSGDPEKKSVSGQLGAITGRVQRDSGGWYYAVHVYETSEEWSFFEHELQFTGEHDQRETFCSDERVRVKVNKRGEGEVIAE